MSSPLLVSTDWLAEHLNDRDIRIVDVRWYLFDKSKNGYSEYLKGHIPGAVFVDIERDLSSPRGQGPGRHPLPKPDAFAEVASRAGIGPATHVVAYDDSGGSSAARLWWLLRYFGHDRVSLLDGGISRWIEENRPLQQEVPSVKATTFVARPRPDMVVDAEAVDRIRKDPQALVLDVRVPERYQGKIEPIDPRAGHIPGAKNAPYGGNLGPDKRFLAQDALRQRFDALGANRASKIVSYCGSGINASLGVFALALAGYADTCLYEGSWSDWSSTPDRPAATGSEP